MLSLTSSVAAPVPVVQETSVGASGESFEMLKVDDAAASSAYGPTLTTSPRLSSAVKVACEIGTPSSKKLSLASYAKETSHCAALGLGSGVTEPGPSVGL